MAHPPDIAQPDERLRQEEALRLRIGGVPYARIAEQLGYADHSGAFYAVQAVLDRQESHSAAELRRVEDGRLEFLWTRAITTAMSDKATPEQKAKAEDRALRVHQARVKLHGLAAPEKLEVGISKEEFITRVEDDLRALGYDPVTGLPMGMVVEPEEEDAEPWSNL
ncbi:hypothetical protein [Nocardia farcinica]|uniref:hypothetical protein n=1 Tax=Nocardia farcinica TaxID=37329 RepID=UPI0018946EA1|nr:hypothetical protein [Nocardia farcinica]MBF6070143.1 hypothetical protein [Nocardia farcinica]